MDSPLTLLPPPPLFLTMICIQYSKLHFYSRLTIPPVAVQPSDYQIHVVESKLAGSLSSDDPDSEGYPSVRRRYWLTKMY